MNSMKSCLFGMKKRLRKTELDINGITFEMAVEAFFDPFLIFIDASRNFEHRDGIIGKTPTNQLLFVVHIQLEDDRIRIISARKATGSEKKRYYEHQQS